MEYGSQLELYQQLIPAFNVKKRLMKLLNYDITNKDIWTYLAKNKWRYASGLTLSDMVNDIITLDITELINNVKGDKQWKKENL